MHSKGSLLVFRKFSFNIAATVTIVLINVHISKSVYILNDLQLEQYNNMWDLHVLWAFIALHFFEIDVSKVINFGPRTLKGFKHVGSSTDNNFRDIYLQRWLSFYGAWYTLS